MTSRVGSDLVQPDFTISDKGLPFVAVPDKLRTVAV
jgi:hypothetical protein